MKFLDPDGKFVLLGGKFVRLDIEFLGLYGFIYLTVVLLEIWKVWLDLGEYELR